MSHLYLLVGLPAAGKTTLARRLELRHRALRFTPDEWMIPLFAHHDADGRRDVLEGRLISIGLRALQLGTSVILDFGFWGFEERASLRVIAGRLGATTTVWYLPVALEDQLARHRGRFRDAPHTTFEVSDEDMAGYRERFAEPDAVELADGPVGPPPPGLGDWADYALGRWPSLELPPANP